MAKKPSEWDEMYPTGKKVLEKVKEIEERLAKRTQGRWFKQLGRQGDVPVLSNYKSRRMKHPRYYPVARVEEQDDAKVIAHAPEDLEFLIDQVKGAYKDEDPQTYREVFGDE